MSLVKLTVPDHLWRFASRHVWSLSLTAAACVMFARLAREVDEGALTPFDGAISGWVRARRGSYDAIMRGLTWLGAFDRLATITVIGTLVLLRLKRPHGALYLVTCAGGCCICNVLLKSYFHRARPDVALKYVIAMPDSFSFPSGHAMGSAGVLGALVVLVFALKAPRLARALAVGLGLTTSVGVAISRIYFGVHYPSDVIGGQLAAAAWVAAVTGWFYPRLLPAESSTAVAALPAE